MDNDKSLFRRDVDVLRGIAVILVVLYHLEIKIFQSGFIGVDIFFVLSGYLIGSIYSRHQSVSSFYERRMRRILPAMLSTLFFSFLLSPLFFLPFEVKKMVDSVVGALLFVPNVIYWRDNDYFSNLDFSPLLHYWSLGIELQYYVIFPALFFLFKKNRYFLSLFALGSLIVCVVLTEISAKSAFFLLPTRLWEFFIGYLAYQVKDAKIVAQIQKSRYSTVCALGLLAALLILSTLPIPSGKFPGIYAFFPVLFSFMYIVIGLGNEKIIESTIFIYLRKIAIISFSIYLIHFPVIFLFKYGPFSRWNEITSLEAVACILITLVLSYASFRYIEKPFRDQKKFPLRNFLISITGIYFLVIATIIVFNYNNYFSYFYHPAKVSVFNAMTDRGAWRCSKIQKLKELRADSCYIYRAKNPEKIVYLVGDSHIDALKEIFVDVAAEKNISVRLNRDRCLLGVNQCSSSHVIKEVMAYRVTDVVMHGYEYSKFNYSDLIVLVRWLKENNINFHIIGPLPDYKVSIPATLYEEIISSRDLIDRKNIDSFTKLLPKEYLQFLEDVAENENVFSYRPEVILCAKECLLMSEKGVYYFDSNHLTITGARVLEPIVLDIYSK